MLDRDIKNFDQKFINNSWKAVSDRLDKEMPQNRSVDGRMSILLAVLLLTSLLCIGYLLWEKPIPYAQLTKEKIVYKTVVVQDQTPRSASESNQATAFTQHNNFHVSFHPKIDFERPNFNTMPSGILGGIKQSSVIGIKENTDVESLKTAHSENIKPVEYNENVSFSLVEPIMKKDLRAHKPQFNIGLLTFVSKNLDYSGYGFTTGVHLNMGKRFGLNTGFAFNIVSKNYMVFPFFPTAQGNLKGSEIDLTRQSTFYRGLNSFKQFYLPISLDYKLTNHLALNGGVKFRYTFDENVDRGLKTLASRELKSHQTFSSTFLNNSNIGLTAGVRVYVSKHWQFNLDSEWGLESIINSNNIASGDSKRYDLNLINFTTQYNF